MATPVDEGVALEIGPPPSMYICPDVVVSALANVPVAPTNVQFLNSIMPPVAAPNLIAPVCATPAENVLAFKKLQLSNFVHLSRLLVPGL